MTSPSDTGSAVPEEVAEKLLRSDPYCTAAITTGWQFTGLLRALRAAGLHVPDDFSVTGFNDMPFLDKLHPALTTVRIPHYQMGAQAARTLLARLNGGLAAVEHVTLLPELIARGSTAPSASKARKAARRGR